MGPRYFVKPIGRPDCFLNAPLPDDVAISDETPAAVAELQGQMFPTAGRARATINTRTWSTDVRVVNPDQPMEPVTLTRTDDAAKALRDTLALEGVPVPADWQPQADSDKSLSIIMPDDVRIGPDGQEYVGTDWELWRARRDATGALLCDWGMRHCGLSSHSPGHAVNRFTKYPDRKAPALPTDPVKAALYEEAAWGSTASSILLCGGILTVEDVLRGRVDHALGLSIVEPAKQIWNAIRWPATRSDGFVVGHLPEGLRFRLPPGTQIPAGVHPLCALVIQAARDYGLVIWDKAGAVSLRGEPGVFDLQQGTAASQVLNGFPWSALQVLAIGSDAVPNVSQ